jgi:hypothetical protein
MKSFLFILITFLFLNICIASDFYYLKNRDGWAGPYENNDLPSNLEVDCKALIDPSTHFPFDKKLMKFKANGASLNCDNDGFAKIKIGKEFDDAKAERDNEKQADIAKGEKNKNLPDLVDKLKTIVCKDHPLEDICK